MPPCPGADRALASQKPSNPYRSGMPPRTSSQDQPSASGGRRGSRASSSGEKQTAEEREPQAASRHGGSAPTPDDTAVAEQSEEQDIASQLNFRDAQTALELSLAELQAQNLDVEQMAGLYRRASRYADRCEQLLQQVEQEVMQWDPAQPQDSPQPYQP